MKAAIYTKYGPPEVLEVREVPKPKPGKDEILVKVHATAVNSGDWRLRKAEPYMVRLFFGLARPRKQILGAVLAGEVEAIGEGVKSFQPGNQVYGMTGMSMGAYAEFAVIPADAALAPMPKAISWEQAACLPFGATTAMHFLRAAGMAEGKSILVIGASGAVGTAAVQLARHMGGEVTGVCSTTNVELVRSLGADKVFDYLEEDFASNGHTWDIVFETVNKTPFTKCVDALKPGGTAILGSAMVGDMLRGIITGITSKKRVITGVASEKSSDLLYLNTLLEKGEYTPVVDKTFTLDEIREAHRYVEQGHKKGNVGIVIGHAGN